MKNEKTQKIENPKPAPRTEEIKDQLAGIFVKEAPAKQPNRLSRRAFLGQTAGLAAILLVGCTPLRILLKTYPDRFEADRELAEHFLRAFVVTVIPGASFGEPNLVRMYADPFYPFHKYCGFFFSDLAQRSQKLFGRERFDLLLPAQRTRVVQSGLEANATTARLYRGAVMIAQVSYYASIYDDDRGCPLIEYYGSDTAFSSGKMYYPNCASLLANEFTPNGNYS